MVHKGTLVLVLGILGTIASILSFLAPLRTFYRVYEKKATEGFQSVQYIATLLSATLWLFYACVKTGNTLLIFNNAFSCVMEAIYLAIYITYCPKKAKISTLRLILLLNVGGFCVIALLTHFLRAKGEASRVNLLGWICVVFAIISVFVSLLSIIRVVIRTKSIEFLPFPLSLLQTVSAVMWLLYGLVLKDIYVTLPNAVGLLSGIVQMVLHAKYRINKLLKDENLPEHKGQVVNENKGEMVTIEMGDHHHKKKNKDEEAEQPQEEEQPKKQPQHKQDQTRVVDDKARPPVEPSIIEIPPPQN